MLRVVTDGLAFPECPRWYDGALFFSDQHDRRVVRLDVATGETATVCEVAGQPSGLGWLPGGDLLVVSMHERRVLRLPAGGGGGGLVEHADVSSVATFHCNDMVVDAVGRAYVGNFGYDFEARAEQVNAAIALVDPDGTVRVAASDLAFPNGSVITPGGATFIVGESAGGGLTAFTIAEDGTLHDRREYARVAGAVPDGICLDAEGAIWFADPISGDLIRVLPGGGEVTDRLSMGDGLKAYACMLGGTDRRTLYGCVSSHHNSARTLRDRLGRIVAVDVDVPGAGLP